MRSKQLCNSIMEVDYYLFIAVYEFGIEKCCQTVLHCECMVIQLKTKKASYHLNEQHFRDIKQGKNTVKWRVF